MRRVPEEELMQEAGQAAAYAAADFAGPHQMLVDELRRRHPLDGIRWVLDIGCGPGDITCRVAAACPGARLVGIDGSAAMLAHAPSMVARHGADPGRFTFIHGCLPGAVIPRRPYQLVISTSLLHHLSDPFVLWRAIARAARPGTIVFVADLRRPTSPGEVRRLVERHAAGEPHVLRQDFHNSLRAAYRLDEVGRQLRRAAFDFLRVEAVGDRHLIVHGVIPAP